VPGLEREFKLRIPSEEHLRALAARLGGSSAPTVLQVNHFFDTRTHALRAALLALRLREEAGRFTLALKGPQLSGPGALAVRPEEERALAAEEARSLLAGRASPLAPLERDGSALARAARARIGAEPLVRIGAFENERQRLGPLAFPPGARGAQLVFELDRTRFPDGTIERELELEVPEGAALAEVERALRELLEELGMPFEAAPSKAERFFRRLEAEPRDRDRGTGTQL
jgi:uncharacterized protein YjbK